MKIKTGNVKHLRHILSNDPVKGYVRVDEMLDMEYKDDLGTWWETKTLLIQGVKYTPRSEEYYNILKELKQKYDIDENWK